MTELLTTSSLEHAFSKHRGFVCHLLKLATMSGMSAIYNKHNKLKELDSKTLLEKILKNPFYRKYYKNQISKGKDLDFYSLPTVTPKHLRNNSPTNFIPQGIKPKIKYKITTSGTTGKPKEIWLSEDDLNVIAETARYFWDQDSFINAEDKLLVVEVPGHATSIFNKAIEKNFKIIGRFSPNEIEKIIEYRGKFSCLQIGAQLLLRLYEICRQKKKNPKSLGIKKISFIGSAVPSKIRNLAEKILGADTRITYANVEMCGFIACECKMKNGYHLLPNEYGIWEILNQKGEPTDEGEFVMTLLKREGTQLIRYKTGDRVRIIKEPCGCGTFTTPRIEVLGRVDDMVVVGYMDLFWDKSMDEAIRLLDIIDYKIEIKRTQDGKDVLDFIFQTQKQVNRENLLKILKRANPELFEQIRLKIIELELHSQKTPLFPNKLKVKRIIDRRDKIC